MPWRTREACISVNSKGSHWLRWALGTHIVTWKNVLSRRIELLPVYKERRQVSLNCSSYNPRPSPQTLRFIRKLSLHPPKKFEKLR